MHGSPRRLPSLVALAVLSLTSGLALTQAASCGTSSCGTCPGEQLCVEDQCREPCIGDGDCGDDQFCKDGACFAQDCGNGAVEGAEECDLGVDNSDNRGCTTTCKLAVCGDSFVNIGVEDCDDGNRDDGDDCTNECTTPICGDGSLHPTTETCDDGDTDVGDGCDGACAVEPGWCCIPGTGCVGNGTAHPTNPCLRCQENVTNTAWSGVAGAGCGLGDPCTSNDDCPTAQCTCVDETCSAQRCGAWMCPCQYDTTGDGACDGLLLPGSTPATHCAAVDCPAYGFYFGIGDDADDGEGNPLCYLAAPTAGLCNAGYCNPTAACDAAVRGPAVEGRPFCKMPVPPGCSAYDPATWDYVPWGTDPYNECPGIEGCVSGMCCDATAAPCHANGDACTGDPECASGHCVDSVCCSSDACPACQSCNLAGSEGDCTAITAPEGPDCSDDCTQCYFGQCVPRPAGDFAECGGTCQACVTGGGNCGDFTGTDGSGCSDQDSFCCSGTCVNPPGDLTEYQWGCGLGDCAGGAWQCLGSEARCTSYGQDCTSCDEDAVVTGSCTLDFGTDCAVASTTPCDQCLSCLDQGTTATCSASGGIHEYYPYATDTTGAQASELCDSGGTQACDGAGTCKLADGQTCIAGAECVSGHCIDDVCCAQPDCGTCQACQAGSGQCVNITATDNPGTCEGFDSFCCDGACVDPGPSPSELNAPCGAGECAGDWTCTGGAGRCSSDGTSCSGPGGVCFDGACP